GLSRPGNVQGGSWQQNWRERYSDYYVKGQTNKQEQRALADCTLTSVVDPILAPVTPPGAQASVTETVTVAMTGHVSDPAVKRWRPNVRGVRTQSGSSSVQAQAEWALRIARGQSDRLTYTVLGWRAAGNLWLPNQVARVADAYADVNREMLISGVTYRKSAQGILTEIRLAWRTAFDRIDEPKQSRRYIFHRSPRSFGPTRQG
ncbi:MAG: phage baseplate assembly protein, partial [Stellaceae bacterium]